MDCKCGRCVDCGVKARLRALVSRLVSDINVANAELKGYFNDTAEENNSVLVDLGMEPIEKVWTVFADDGDLAGDSTLEEV